MLFITIQHPAGFEQVHRTHVGDTNIHSIVNSFNISQVTEVQADGDELDACFELLGRTPNDRPVHTFIGDAAKEIVINWV